LTKALRVLQPYPIDARGLLAREPSQSQQDEIDFDRVLRNGKSMSAQSLQPVGDDTMDMETLADQTGGEAFVMTNNITGAIRQAVENSAATYTLGFYIDRPSIDGKFHELKVEVKRKGVKGR
jgi:VWFA-related protein